MVPEDNGVVRGRVKLQLDLESEEIAGIVYSSLLPETTSVPSERAVTTIETADSAIILRIEADDLTALRAATNSFLSWISSCLRLLDSVTGQNA
jgi:KEOPS complex subunit Pcc1